MMIPFNMLSSMFGITKDESMNLITEIGDTLQKPGETHISALNKLFPELDGKTKAKIWIYACGKQALSSMNEI